MVRIRAKIEKNIVSVSALLKRANIENTLCGEALVKIRAKIEKKHLFGRAKVPQGLGKKYRKHPFWQGFGYG